MKKIWTYLCGYFLGCLSAVVFGAQEARVTEYKNAYEAFKKADQVHDMQAAAHAFDTLAQLYITDEKNTQLLERVSQALGVAKVYDFIEELFQKENVQKLRGIKDTVDEITAFLKSYMQERDDAKKNMGSDLKKSWASTVNAQNAIEGLTNLYNSLAGDDDVKAYIFKATTLDRLLINQLNSELDKIRVDVAKKIAQEYVAKKIDEQLERRQQYKVLEGQQSKVEKEIAKLHQDVFDLAQAVIKFQEDAALNGAYVAEFPSEEERKATAKLVEHLLQEHDAYLKAHPIKEEKPIKEAKPKKFERAKVKR